MICHRYLRLLLASVVVLMLPCAAEAQADTQLWTEFKFNWIKSRQLTLGVDAEPKVLIGRRLAILAGRPSTSPPRSSTAAANGSIWSARCSSAGRDKPTISTPPR